MKVNVPLLFIIVVLKEQYQFIENIYYNREKEGINVVK